MADKTVSVLLRAITGQYNAQMLGAARNTAALQASTARATRGIGRMQGAALGGSKALMGLQAGLGPLGGMATKTAVGFGAAGGLAFALAKSAGAAIQFESDFAGVRKTVEGSEVQLQGIATGFRQMSTEIPASTEQLTQVGEAAGQLGIQTGTILGFSRVMVDLGNTTNLEADQAATALARLANITQMPQNQFDRLGSTVVALGNNFATTESEIVEMGLRLAGAGQVVGLTEADILGLSTTLTSLGVRAEAGGTAFSRVMLTMEEAVGQAGGALDAFAEVAGMSASEFAAQWREDPARAIAAFIEGLSGMHASGGDVIAVLEDLNLNEIRVRDAILRTMGAQDLLTNALDLGARAWEDNNALTREAEQRYGTTASKIEVAKNQIKDLAISVGDEMLPAIGDMAAGLDAFIDGLTGSTDGLESLGDKIAFGTGQGIIMAGEFIGVNDVLRLLTGSTDDTADSMEHAGVRLDHAASAAANATPEIQSVGGAAEEMGGKVEEASILTMEFTKRHEEMQDALESFNRPLGIYTDLLDAKMEAEKETAEATADATDNQSDSWEDYVGDVRVSLTDYAAALEEQNQKTERWRQNIVTVTERGGRQVAGILLDMGEEGIQLTADMADATDEEFQRMKRALVRQSRLAGQGSVKELDVAMRIMEQTAGRGGARSANALARMLGIGVREVIRISNRYGVELAEGLNPVIRSVGGREVAVPRRLARIPRFFEANFRAEGGIDPHIARSTTVLFGEPETGGEAFIPLGARNRRRSQELTAEVARRLGGVARFQRGGFASARGVPPAPVTDTPPGAVGDTGDAAMRHTRRLVVDWLKENLAPQLTAGIGWQAMMNALRVPFPGLALISGFRPGAITATGNRSYHALGRAVDIPPRMDVFDWIRANYMAKTRELIFSPAGFRQVWNGQPHLFSGITRAMHWDHIHWAMARGGILDPNSRVGQAAMVGVRNFDRGGMLPPGATLAVNTTGRPEPVGHVTAVLSPVDRELLRRAIGPDQKHVTVNAPVTALTNADPIAIGRQVAWAGKTLGR